MRYRLVAPKYINKPILEFLQEEIDIPRLEELNAEGYGIYYFPNYSTNKTAKYLKGGDIDVFEWVFADMDLNDGIYTSKQEFAVALRSFYLKPTKTIISGHGVHAYWKISDLTRDDYLQLQKRLIQKFKTDKSIWTVLQLMRKEGFKNTKEKDNWVEVKIANDPSLNSGKEYTVKELDTMLPKLTQEDARDIKEHLEKIDGVEDIVTTVATEDLPEKFKNLLESSKKLRDHFYNPVDRSESDMKLANVLQKTDFTREEAINILLHTQKGIERGITYVRPLVNKVYDNPLEPDEEDELLNAGEIERLNRENFEYKVLKENERVKRAKEVDKKRGKFSLSDSEERRLAQFEDYTNKDINAIGTHLPFICKTLTDAIALSPQDYVFIGGLYGNGKSSVAANIVMPIIEAGKKVLYLSTEESQNEIIKRHMALLLNIDYNNERKWSAKERLMCFEKYRKYVDKLVIIDYLYENADGVKSEITSIEGLENVLNCVEFEGFDLIVVDYLSKISNSLTNPALQPYTIIDCAAKFLEEYNKRVRVPIVAFGQLHVAKDENQDFKDRIRGSKSIGEYVTTAIEIDTDKEADITNLICHKLRKTPPNFSGRVALRFDKGKYREI